MKSNHIGTIGDVTEVPLDIAPLIFMDNTMDYELNSQFGTVI